MNRAYSTLQLKAVDEDRRILTGIATTPEVDRMGDIVEPRGAQFKLPIPFLWQHDASQPVGHVVKAKVTDKGIEVEVHLTKIDEPGKLKDRLDEAWQSMKSGLVRGMSIGFAPVESARIDGTYGMRFLKWLWLELSGVTIAANADASITTIKALDEGFLAASGRGKPGVTTTARAGASNREGKKVKTYTQEALAALQEARQTKAARMAELLETKGDGGFTDEQRDEFNTTKSDISNLDDEIAVCETHLVNIKSARPTDAQRGAPHIRKYKDVEPKFKGEEGLKRAMCNVQAMSEVKQGRFVTPAQLAEQKYGKTNPTLVAIMKAGVAGGGTDSGEWGAELVGVDNRYTGDFVEYLYGMTVFDRLPLRTVPANVGIKGQDGAFTGYWVGQSKAIKVSKGDFSSVSTTPYKAAGLTVVSNEWLRDITGDGLSLCGQGLREAVAQAVDTLFLSATAISNGVSPAGILNGVSAINTNGSDAQSVATDVKALFAPFITAKNLSGGLAWVMSPTTAVALSLMQNALGQIEFPGIGPNGGTFKGYPVFVGDNVAAGDVILMKPSDIWKIGDMGVSLSVSDSAMIEQDDAPTGATDTPVAASATMVSMFQEDSTAIKVVRPISWGKRRSTAVQYIGDAAWGAESS